MQNPTGPSLLHQCSQMLFPFCNFDHLQLTVWEGLLVEQQLQGFGLAVAHT